jgi:hypothetical protein
MDGLMPAEVEKICLDCGTDLTRDRFEYVCPSDGHRFQVKDGKLVHATRHMSGPGPDGVPDRRRYPSLDGGITRRTVEPKDGRPRGYDPIDAESKRGAQEATRNARNVG